MLPHMGDSVRKVLAENLVRLMEGEGLTIKQLHAKCPAVSTGTIDRVRREAVGLSVDNLAALAAAFDLQPSQLLTPGLKAAETVDEKLSRLVDEKLSQRLSILPREGPPSNVAGIGASPLGAIRQRTQLAGGRIRGTKGHEAAKTSPSTTKKPGK